MEDNDEQIALHDLIVFVAKLHRIAFSGSLIVEFEDGLTDSEHTSVTSTYLTRQELSTLLRELGE